MHLSAKVVGSAMRAPALARQMSSTGAHVWINKDTKVICQGFTGTTVLRLISSMDGGDIARLLASWQRGFFGPQRLIGPCSDLPLNGGGCRALSTARRPSSTAQRWWAVPTRRRRVRCTWVCPFSQTYARYCCAPCLSPRGDSAFSHVIYLLPVGVVSKEYVRCVQAKKQTGCHASVIYVPPPGAAEAILEARLSVTEYILESYFVFCVLRRLSPRRSSWLFASLKVSRSRTWSGSSRR